MSLDLNCVKVRELTRDTQDRTFCKLALYCTLNLSVSLQIDGGAITKCENGYVAGGMRGPTLLRPSQQLCYLSPMP